MEYDYSFNACYESVKFLMENAPGTDPFEELGRAIIRAEQDVFFNKTMIEAWKAYIRNNNLSWNKYAQ